MIKVEFTQAEFQVLAWGLEAAARELGMRLQQGGLNAAKDASSRLTAVIALADKLQAAADASANAEPVKQVQAEAPNGPHQD